MSKQQTSVYPQAQPFTDEEVDAFLARPLIAKLCTHNEDGTIHVVPIWFRYESGEILFGTQEVTRKVQNVKGDKRVTILVDAHEPVLQGVIILGRAELDYEDVLPRRVSIFEKYIGAKEAPGLAQTLASSWAPVIIRVKPHRIISFDYSKGFGLSSDPNAEMTKIV